MKIIVARGAMPGVNGRDRVFKAVADPADRAGLLNDLAAVEAWLWQRHHRPDHAAEASEIAASVAGSLLKVADEQVSAPFHLNY